MTVTLSSYLANVVSAVGTILQLQNSEGTVVTDDTIIEAISKVVYGKFCNYIHRPLIQQSVTDRMPAVNGYEPFRVTPVSSITSVYYWGSTTAVAVTSYSLLYNNLYFYEPNSSDEITLSNTIDLVVNYVGGYTTLVEGDELFSAFVDQTIAYYHIKDIIGFNAYSSDRGTSRTLNDNFDLLISVKDILDKYKYTGQAYGL